MRTTFADATVRLYFLDPDNGSAETLCYAPLSEAMALAARQSEQVQEGLYLATDNDVVAYLDLMSGSGS